MRCHEILSSVLTILLPPLLTAALTTPTLAQFGGIGGFGPGDGANGIGGSTGFGDAGFGLDISAWMRQRTIHGILASLVFVILFPLGSIAMATLKGPWGYRVHSLVQMVGWALFIAAAALGFRMLGQPRAFGRDGADAWVSPFVSFFFPFFFFFPTPRTRT